MASEFKRMEFEKMLADLRQRVKQGNCMRVSLLLIRDFIPSCGMDDLENLALAFGGHRPVPRQTPEDRFKEIAERAGWKVHYETMDGTFIIEAI